MTIPNAAAWALTAAFWAFTASRYAPSTFTKVCALVSMAAGISAFVFLVAT